MDSVTFTRLEEERDDLLGKLTRLQKFTESAVYWGLPEDEKSELCDQQRWMGLYLEILNLRVLRHTTNLQ